jgi:flagellar biosynthesis/type III secretory pathway protein FliH
MAKGMAKGIAQGMEQGMAQGTVKGRVAGIQEERQRVAAKVSLVVQKMRDLGMADKDIANLLTDIAETDPQPTAD